MSYPKMDQDSNFRFYQLNSSLVSNTSSASKRSKGLNVMSIHTIKTNPKAKQDIFARLISHDDCKYIQRSNPENPQPNENKKSIFYSDENRSLGFRVKLPEPSDYQSTLGQKRSHFCDCKRNTTDSSCSQICDSCLNHLNHQCLEGHCCPRCVQQKAALIEPPKTVQKVPVFEELNEEEFVKFFNLSTAAESSPVRPRPPCSINSSASQIQQKEPIKKRKKSTNVCYCRLKGCSGNLCTCKKEGLKCSTECQCGIECHNQEGRPDCQGCKTCSKPQTKHTSTIQTRGFNINMSQPNIIQQIMKILMEKCTESIHIEEQVQNEFVCEVSQIKQKVEESNSGKGSEIRMSSEKDSRKDGSESSKSVGWIPFDFLQPSSYQPMDLE